MTDYNFITSFKSSLRPQLATVFTQGEKGCFIDGKKVYAREYFEAKDEFVHMQYCKKAIKGSLARWLVFQLVIFLPTYLYVSSFFVKLLNNYGIEVSSFVLFVILFILISPWGITMAYRQTFAPHRETGFTAPHIIAMFINVAMLIPGLLMLLGGGDPLYNAYFDNHFNKNFRDMRRAEINVSNASMHASPSSNSRAIKTLNQNDRVYTVGVSESGWMVITRDDNGVVTRGWVNADYLDYNDKKPMTTVRTATVVSGTVDLHMYKNEKSFVFRTINNNDYNIVVLGEEVNGWFRVYAWDHKQERRGYGMGFAPANTLTIQ